MRSSNLLLIVTCLVAASMLATETARAVNHNESVNGDLSNSGSTPTSLTLAAGTNSITATMPGTDLDFLTIHVPPGHELTALTLVSYSSTDDTSFIGMKNGTTIAVTNNAANLNGYTHFGTGPGNVGQNILDDIGIGDGSVGFTPPLPTGAFSFWIQQASSAGVSYQFDYLVAALPPTGISGDYTDDGTVDAADYVVWRKTDGTMHSLPNNPHSGPIGEEAYNTWHMHFAEVLPGGNGAASVPEPTACLLLLQLVLSIAANRNSRRRASSR